AGLPSIDKAEKRDDKKGAYYVAIIERPGRATSDVIAAIVPEIVRSFPWPKSMRWGSGKLRWMRPLHSILCLLDGKVVDFEIDGIRSGKETRGHRFMAPEPFSVKSFADYAKKLREAKVILDGEERARIIAEEARSQAVRHGLALVEDEGLLAENAGLTEWPVALMGSFDESFLAVPPEVLSTAMKAHQKCFSIRNGENLANRFVLVANLKAEDKGHAIIAGNERVIAARLADAKFFFDHDRKVLLPDRVPKLKEIVFHEKLGTQYERVQRVYKLAREIAPLVGADPDLAERAAILAKADLVRHGRRVPRAARGHGPLLRARAGGEPCGRRRHRRSLQAGRAVRRRAARARGDRRGACRQARQTLTRSAAPLSASSASSSRTALGCISWMRSSFRSIRPSRKEIT